MNTPERENEMSYNESDRDAIASRAYEKWESSGRPDGQADEHWREAERELREKRNHDPSPSGGSDESRQAKGGGRHGPAPRSHGKPDRGTRARPPGIEEATSAGEDLPQG